MNVDRGGEDEAVASVPPKAAGKVSAPPVVRPARPPSSPAAPPPRRVPPPLMSPPGNAGRPATFQQILAQLDRTIEFPGKASDYNLSVILVGAVLVMLPTIYFLAILLLLVVLFLIWPPIAILVGLLAFLLMLKPVFAPRGRPGIQYTLIPEREPAMFQFVERLCKSLGSPVPTQINVSMEANASASSRNLVLTIGLPLCSGLSLRQLAGVMAHEFGHFTQGSAMRMMYVFGRMSDWLARIVTERDAWDLALLHAMHRGDILTALAAPIYGLIWLNRMVLFGIVMCGRLVCAHMLHQMEFDADLYEIQVAGSETFCETSLALHPLNVAVDRSLEDLGEAWMEKRLGDNFPAMVIAKVAQMQNNPAQVAKMRRQALEQPARIFDTHPSTSDRIARAQQQNAPGIFPHDAPASILFANFEELCKGVTSEFYKQELGLQVEAWNIVASETVISEQEMHNEAMKTLARFFQGEILGAYQIFLPTITPGPGENPQETLALLKRSRQQMLSGLNSTIEVLQRYRYADAYVRDMTHAWVILDAGFSFDPEQFGLHDANYAQVRSAREAARQDRDLRQQQLAEAIRSAQDRMSAALRLLHVPKVAQRISSAAANAQRCGELHRTLVVLQQAWPGLLQLRDHCMTLSLLLDVAASIRGHNPLYQRLFEESNVIARALNDVRWKVSQVAYPFPHAHGHITIGNYALSHVPPADQPVDLYEAAHDMYDKLLNLYFRAMAYLAMSAEKVEEMLGMERLPDPFGCAWDPWAPSADISTH